MPKQTLKAQPTAHTRKAPLPTELQSLLSVSAHMDVTVELHQWIAQACLPQEEPTALTGAHVSTLLPYTRTEEERLIIWRAMSHTSLHTFRTGRWGGALNF